MCSQNLQRRVSNSGYNTNNDSKHPNRKHFKFDDLTNRQAQPRVFTNFKQQQQHPGYGKLNEKKRNVYHGRQDHQELPRNKRVRFSDGKHGQEKSYDADKKQHKISPSKNRDFKPPAQNGKGSWELACALAYRYLLGDFVAQNEAADCNSSSISSSSSESSADSVNYNENHDTGNVDGVNFVLYLLSGTAKPTECVGRESSVEQLAIPDVVNPTQAAQHWLSASQTIRDSPIF